MTDGQGFAAVCDEHGFVREVIRDTLGFAIGRGSQASAGQRSSSGIGRSGM